MKKSLKSLGCFGIVVIVIIILGLFIISIFFNPSSSKYSTKSKTKYKRSVVDKVADNIEDKSTIALINIEGIISSSKKDGFLEPHESIVEVVKSQLKEAEKDANIKGVILRLNTPGGEVTASDIIYNAVKKLNKIKPVIVYMDSVAASGGYYIACGASKIISNETTITGSIGVIIQSMNVKDLMGKVFIEPLVFKSGSKKDILNPMRDMTEGEKVYIQDMVDNIYDKFLSIVSQGRNKSVENLRKLVGDGRIILGQDAMELGLVDSLGYIEDAYKEARKLANAPTATIIKYSKDVSFFELLNMTANNKLFGMSNSKNLSIDLTSGLIPKLQPGLFYYLPPIFVNN